MFLSKVIFSHLCILACTGNASLCCFTLIVKYYIYIQDLKIQQKHYTTNLSPDYAKLSWYFTKKTKHWERGKLIYCGDQKRMLPSYHYFLRIQNIKVVSCQYRLIKCKLYKWKLTWNEYTFDSFKSWTHLIIMLANFRWKIIKDNIMELS